MPPKGDGIILFSLMLGILLAALDSTVVATSTAAIVQDLGGFERFGNVAIFYFLTGVVAIPLAGKLSDRWGRRPLYLAGMGVFLVGSVLCGLARDMTELAAARSVQGLGGGALFPVALATVADLYAPGDRGKVQGAFGAVFGLSSVIGPFLGGWIVDNVDLFGVASWRWVFYINVPIGLVGLAMVATHFPRLRKPLTTPIDYAGMATLTVALVAGVLALNWGGDRYAWGSVEIYGLVALSAVMLAAFLFAETRATDPVLPLVLFREPIFAVSAVASLLLGVGMFGIIVFLPVFMQGVVGISATYAGAVLMPLMLSLVAGSIASGLLTKRFGYKVFTIVGSFLVAAGYFVLSLLDADANLPLAVGGMITVGIGLGFTIQTFVIAVQNVVERRHIGAATSALTLFRQLGGTIGLTVFTLVLRERLTVELPKRVPGAVLEQILASPFIAGKLERVPQVLLQASPLPPPVLQGIKVAYADSMEAIFLGGAVIALAALLASAFLRSRPLKSAADYHARPPPAADEASAPAAVAAAVPPLGACAFCGKPLARVHYVGDGKSACGACYFTVVPDRARWTRGGAAPVPAQACRVCGASLAGRVHWGRADERVCGVCYFGRLAAPERAGYAKRPPEG